MMHQIIDRGILKLLQLSDLHVGSNVGLCPPEFKLELGNIVSFGENYHQEWLWQQYEGLIERAMRIIGDDPFAVLFNGDLTEGIHHGGKETLADTIAIHTENAINVITKLVELADLRLFTFGTRCHTNTVENDIARKFGATPETSVAKQKWLFEMNGVLIDAAHHMSVTKRAYLEGSALSIEMGNARQNYQRSGHRCPQMFLRGHRHTHGVYSDGRGRFCVTGAFQMLTSHGHKVVTDSIPAPSMIVHDFSKTEFGTLPTTTELLAIPPETQALAI